MIVTHDPSVSEHVQRTIAIRDGRTSTEVHRHRVVADDGTETMTSQELTVLDGAGRLQLPAEYIDQLHLAEVVRLALQPDHLTVSAHDRTPPTHPPNPSGRHSKTEDKQ